MLKLFKKKDAPPYLYSEKELDEYEKNIVRKYGTYESVLHEIVSPDIHLDVIPIPPTGEAPYYKIITMGAGAYRMNVPKELREYKLEHAEYVIYLPPDWDISSPAPESYWPIGMLKKIARLPISCDTWLGYGHTIHGNPDGSSLSADTQMNSFVLVTALGSDGEDSSIQLSSGKYINMYQLIPLYQEELEFKLSSGLPALLDRFPDEEYPPVVHPNRKNICLP